MYLPPLFLKAGKMGPISYVLNGKIAMYWAAAAAWPPSAASAAARSATWAARFAPATTVRPLRLQPGPRSAAAAGGTTGAVAGGAVDGAEHEGHNRWQLAQGERAEHDPHHPPPARENGQVAVREQSRCRQAPFPSSMNKKATEG